MSELYFIPGRPAKHPDEHDNYISYQQLTVADTAVGLTVPPNANKAIIVVEDATIRWRADGTDPTSIVGTKAFVNATIILDTVGDLSNFKAIRQGSTNAQLSINYYEHH